MAGTTLAAGARVRREDGGVLLVRRPGADGVWSLPMALVPGHEVAETTVKRVLGSLHLTPGVLEFAETLTLSDTPGALTVVNVFDCTGWSGRPRYSASDFEDVAWVQPAALASIEMPEAMRTWLAGERVPPDRFSLAGELIEAYQELTAAYASVPEQARQSTLDGNWSPVDVLTHVASAEAYYREEIDRLADRPGYTWRPFNVDQWDADRRTRRATADDEAQTRLATVHYATLQWANWLRVEQLEQFGSHPTRGVVRISDRVEKLARHYREHADQLRAMAASAREWYGIPEPATDATSDESPRDEEPHAAADR